MKIAVRNNDVDQALKVLKKRLQREGLFRELKSRQHYIKPSQIKARAKDASKKRAAKAEAKRLARDQ